MPKRSPEDLAAKHVRLTTAHQKLSDKVAVGHPNADAYKVKMAEYAADIAAIEAGTYGNVEHGSTVVGVPKDGGTH